VPALLFGTGLPLLREHPLQGPDPIVQLFDQRGGCCVMPFVMPIVMPCVREVNVAPSLPPPTVLPEWGYALCTTVPRYYAYARRRISIQSCSKMPDIPGPLGVLQRFSLWLTHASCCVHNPRRMVYSTSRVCMACMGQCHRNPL
jgi:hypothetical protein